VMIAAASREDKLHRSRSAGGLTESNADAPLAQ